jgi:uncharacterized protein YkwD
VIENPREVPVHHRPARATPSDRLARFLDLTVGFLRRRSPRRGARLALGAVISTVLTALVLSVPVVSGAVTGKPFVALDSFAAASAVPTSEGHSPVVMGRDGRPVTSSTSAGTSTSSAQSEASSTDAFAGGATTPPVPTSDAPAAPAAPAESETASGSAPAAGAATAPAAGSAAAAPAPATAEPGDPSVEGQVLALVNVQRAAAGCGALTADPALAAVARAHSADMRDRHFFDHVNPDGLDPFDRAAAAGLVAHAENIAYGQRDPAAVMDAWMNSAGHRANILNCDLTRLGVGIADGDGGPWWTQLFA